MGKIRVGSVNTWVSGYTKNAPGWPAFQS